MQLYTRRFRFERISNEEAAEIRSCFYKRTDVLFDYILLQSGAVWETDSFLFKAEESYFWILLKFYYGFYVMKSDTRFGNFLISLTPMGTFVLHVINPNVWHLISLTWRFKRCELISFGIKFLRKSFKSSANPGCDKAHLLVFTREIFPNCCFNLEHNWQFSTESFSGEHEKATFFPRSAS